MPNTEPREIDITPYLLAAIILGAPVVAVILGMALAFLTPIPNFRP